MTRIFLPALMTAFILTAIAQSPADQWQLVLQDNQVNIEAIAMYPPDIRTHLLEAARHPEALIRIEQLQTQTKTGFRKLLEPYPQATQQEIWDLTPQPRLIERIVTEARGNPDILRQILNDYPTNIRENALRNGVEHLGLLARIYEMERSSDKNFRNLLLDFPPRTETALRALLPYPELLSLLTDNLRMTIQLGDLYQRQPEWMNASLDSLSLEVARNRARDLEQWQQDIQDNPEAMQDYEQAAQSFANEYGYDDQLPPQPEVQYAPYPYWYSYPYWYDYPRWRPYPYWYDWGFYYLPGGGIVIIDFPSHYFVHWYFRQPIHLYRFPYLGNQLSRHYYGPRRSMTTIYVGLQRWQRRNATIITEAWLRENNGRVDRFREYGRMEEDRLTYNRTYPDRPLSQPEFIRKNTRQFPNLARELPADQGKVSRTTTPAPARQPAPAPEAQPRRESPRPQQPPRTLPAPSPAPAPTPPRRESVPPKQQPPRTIPAPAPTQPRKEVSPKTERAPAKQQVPVKKDDKKTGKN
jgi:hypothetical protein